MMKRPFWISIAAILLAVAMPLLSVPVSAGSTSHPSDDSCPFVSPATPVAAATGELCVDVSTLPDDAYLNPSDGPYRFFIAQVSLENMGTAPITFDTRKVTATSTTDPATFQPVGMAWMLENGGSAEPVVTMPPGKEIVGQVIFVLP